MAFIENRKTRVGARRYRVWWRLGGTRYGEPQSETFATLAEARTFKAAFEMAGHQWPPNYVPGVGWVDESKPAAETDTEPVLFGDYAVACVRRGRR